MNNKPAPRSPVLTAGSLFITVVCLVLILLLEQKVYGHNGAWIHYLLFIPAFIALQYFFDAILSLFMKTVPPAYRVIPVVILLLFFAVLTSLR